jgi:hypothetical protein
MLQFDHRNDTKKAEFFGVPGRGDLTSNLIGRGLIDMQHAQDAALIARKQAVPLPDVLCRTFDVPAYSIADILARQAQAQLINPVEQRPDQSLLLQYGPQNCLHAGIMPWRRIGDETVVLTTRPDHFARHRDALTATFGPVRMAVTTLEHLHRSVNRECGHLLVHAAETKVAAFESCRGWNTGKALWIGLALAVLLLAGAVAAPLTLIAVLTSWAIITLIFTTALKATAALIGWRLA